VTKTGNEVNIQKSDPFTSFGRSGSIKDIHLYIINALTPPRNGQIIPAKCHSNADAISDRILHNATGLNSTESY